jgi:hypothetical protein
VKVENGAVAQFRQERRRESRLVRRSVGVARKRAIQVFVDVPGVRRDSFLVGDDEPDGAFERGRLGQHALDSGLAARFVAVEARDDREFGRAIADSSNAHRWRVARRPPT